MEPIKVNLWTDYLKQHPNFTGCLINRCNDIARFKDSVLHNENGPAVEYNDNTTKFWFLNGVPYDPQHYKIEVRKIKLERILTKTK